MKLCEALITAEGREEHSRCPIKANYEIDSSECHSDAVSDYSCGKHIGVFIHQGPFCTGSWVSRIEEIS